MDLLQNLMDTCTTLTRRVELLEQDKIAQSMEISKLKQRVKKLEKRNKLKVLKLRRLKRVGSAQRIDTSDDTIMDDPSLNGRGGPISPIAIQTMDFGLKNDMIQQMSTRSSARNFFPPLDNPKLTIRRRSHVDPTLLNDFEIAAKGYGDDANKHLDKFLHVTQSIKVNGVIDNAFRLYLFPHSLTHHATAWFDCLPRNSINTFEQMAKMFLGKYFPPSMVAKLRNEITNFRQRPDESLFEALQAFN
nr:hypothetical protein [Tanacetum cinerariifolium]